ncbi:MAG: hypothetical protein HFJ24_02770 [Clostridia bacterium]|nr:hypothetical protein [Clostridia bacterium]MCI9274954.1 hypothetical protein [Clostridia bacterium]
MRGRGRYYKSEYYFGDTSKIEEETLEEFRTSSMYHILAVSGTHVRNSTNGDNI